MGLKDPYAEQVTTVTRKRPLSGGIKMPKRDNFVNWWMGLKDPYAERILNPNTKLMKYKQCLSH